jgi:hypothetical protein
MFYRIANILDKAYFPDLLKIKKFEAGIGRRLEDYLFGLGVLNIEPNEIEPGMSGLKVREILNSIQVSVE